MKYYLMAIGFALAVVGGMDFEDAQAQQDLYCEMVESGAWGDYNENFDEVCVTE